MRILNLLDELESSLEEAKKAPLSSMVMVDRDALLEIVDEIRVNLPEVVRQAEQIARQRQRILSEASAEATAVIADAKVKAEELINEHEITQQAYSRAEEINSNANHNAKEVRLGALAYADDVLAELENVVKGHMENIVRNRQELQG